MRFACILIGFAVDEEVDPTLLVGELTEERLLELGQGRVFLARYWDGLGLIFRCVYLDQSLELVIIDVTYRVP
jgi:hypothetical protein